MKHEFYHWLYDVLVLSGIPVEIALKAKNPDTVTEADAEEVRAFACKLGDNLKGRLSDTNKMTIVVGDK